jgi:hypothetical protein
MRLILLRDDDTNALTPIECLETLYRPFLDRGLPVNLATIPEVRVDARTPDGAREGFLPPQPSGAAETVALGENRSLTAYLHANPRLHVVQHGCYHDRFEFDRSDRAEIVRRLDRGRMRLREAGFENVNTFVAPHDRFAPASYDEVARRYSVISTGWFEMRRLPLSWRLKFLWKKVTGRPHWRAGTTYLLSHPGCLLSHQRPPETILPAIKRAIQQQDITVLVTHWWEYFPEGVPNKSFIRVLHQTAEYLASDPSLTVIPFSALTSPREISQTSGAAMPATATG